MAQRLGRNSIPRREESVGVDVENTPVDWAIPPNGEGERDWEGPAGDSIWAAAANIMFSS